MSGLDSRYITTLNLEPYFVNKQTGAPLAAGTVHFYKDDDRNVGKLVYQLVQDVITGNYSYEALPNPITLSGVGTFKILEGITLQYIITHLMNLAIKSFIILWFATPVAMSNLHARHGRFPIATLAVALAHLLARITN